jgi:hypothetical protein
MTDEPEPDGAMIFNLSETEEFRLVVAASANVASGMNVETGDTGTAIVLSLVSVADYETEVEQTRMYLLNEEAASSIAADLAEALIKLLLLNQGNAEEAP